MVKTYYGILMALALSLFSVAQSVPPSQTNNGTSGATPARAESPAATQPATPRIAPGSVIPVQLTTTVDAKKAKTGEQVTAKVTQDLKASNGMLLMPKDTEIIGHVTEAQARNKEEKGSQVGIVFDHAVVNNGNVSYPLSIQAIIAPQVLQNQNTADNGGGSSAEAPSGSSPSPSMPGQQGGAGRSMGGGQAAPNAPSSQAGSDTPSSNNKPPTITGQTQGVVGFSHLKLESASNPAQASVISSEKNNVKLDNGTLMLLRVNP